MFDNTVTMWDYIDSNGKTGIFQEHPKLSKELAAKVSGYMKSGYVLLAAPGLRNDFFDSSKRIDMIKYIDGIWQWSAEDAYYVEQYNLSPNEEFLEYVKARDFLPRVPTDLEIEKFLSQYQRP